jgi:hypothetical protein
LTYDIAGTFDDGAALTGHIAIDFGAGCNSAAVSIDLQSGNGVFPGASYSTVTHIGATCTGGNIEALYNVVSSALSGIFYAGIELNTLTLPYLSAAGGSIPIFGDEPYGIINDVQLGVRYFEGIASAPTVPEPGTLALLGLGLSGLMLKRRHRTH